MELIHADAALLELGELTNFDQYDAISGLGYAYEDNDFELAIPDATWLAKPVEKKHFIYELGTEWGGRVENIQHIGTTVKCSGPTWRGMLARKIISPPGGSAYKVITSVDANAAIATLVGSSLGSLFVVEAAASGITVSGSFRYANLLGGIHNMLTEYGARLKVTFDGVRVKLQAVPIVDYTDTRQFDQDYFVPIQTTEAFAEAYNHVIALGSGLLAARTVVELWRLDDGSITSTPQPATLDDKQTVYDYPNAESTAELTEGATEKLIEYSPVQRVEIDLMEVDKDLHLGDVVGGADQVTGLSITRPITQKILTVSAAGLKINYKAGD